MSESEVTNASLVYDSVFGEDRFALGNAFGAFAEAAGDNTDGRTLVARCFEQWAQELETKCVLSLLFGNKDLNSTTTITKPNTNKELHCVFNKATADRRLKQRNHGLGHLSLHVVLLVQLCNYLFICATNIPNRNSIPIIYIIITVIYIGVGA